MAPDVLIVFLKQPRPGQVKTRLAAVVGDETAAALYRALAEMEVARTEPRPGDYERLFFFTPAGARAEMERWFPGETWVEQVEGDLGQRMAGAFAESFRRGARRAALIGTDVPWVTRDLVTEALCALDSQDVVLGPARDGGYYLIALDRPRPTLFQGLAWSTPSVLSSTAERAGSLGLGVRLLEELPDIDSAEDVRREWPRLEPLLRERPALLAALRPLVGTPDPG